MAINLLQSFANGFRLFRGEDLNKMVSLLNGTTPMPATFNVQAGSSAQSFRDGGNVNVQCPATASEPGNAAATTDTVLFTATLPANAFDLFGRQVTITAGGSFAANGNNKRVQIYIGSDAQTVGSAIVTTATTSIASTGTLTTNSGGWIAGALLTKKAAANTQRALNLGIQAGTSHLGTTAPVDLTLTEANPIVISITGASQTTGAANDVVGATFDLMFNN